MIRKSFFNPFSSLLLALAGLAFLVDTLPQTEGQTGVFAPAVLFAMWLVGGLVRLFYENEAKRSFDRHMLKANHAAVWKRVDACWIQVDADQLMPGDVIRLSGRCGSYQGRSHSCFRGVTYGRERSDRQAGRGDGSRGHDYYRRQGFGNRPRPHCR